MSVPGGSWIHEYNTPVMTCTEFCKLHSFLSLSSSLFAKLRWDQLPLTFWVTSSQCDMEKVKKTERKWKWRENTLSLSVSNLPFEMKLAKTWSWEPISGGWWLVVVRQNRVYWIVLNIWENQAGIIWTQIVSCFPASFNLLMREIGKPFEITFRQICLACFKSNQSLELIPRQEL